MLRPFATPHETAPVIRAGGLVHRPLPVNLRAADRALFAHELERAIPDTRLLELRGVSMDASGLLFKGTQILPESFSSPVACARFFRDRGTLLKLAAANAIVRRRRTIAASCLVISDDWSAGYFHWLLDCLARLFAVKDRARDLMLILPHAFERLEFVQASLRLFPLGGVDYVRRGELVECEHVVMPTHTAPSGNYNEGLAREVRRFILDAYRVDADVKAEDRLYVSRSRAPRRRIVNEAAVLDVFARFGFRVVHFEDHTFEQQVRLAASASHVVSNHGAGLANMLFMRTGGGVLELRRTGERERNWFFNLANATGLAYYYQNCDADNPHSDAHAGHVIVDTKELEESLESFVAARMRS